MVENEGTERSDSTFELPGVKGVYDGIRLCGGNGGHLEPVAAPSRTRRPAADRQRRGCRSPRNQKGVTARPLGDFS